MARVEVNVRKDDAMLVRNVVRALSSPEQEQTARALLREHFGSRQAEGLKPLLAAAPLEGIDLSRDRDFGWASSAAGACVVARPGRRRSRR